jgi:hypothetical protein
MTRIDHSGLGLFSQNKPGAWLCGLLCLTIFPHATLRAQTPVYSHSEYWGVAGWNTEPHLEETQLQISNTNNQVNLWWPAGITNAAVIQATTNLSAESEWTTLPNQPIESAGYFGAGVIYQHKMTVVPQFDQQYFRLVAVGTTRLPVFSFAIFYNDQLEFTQSPPLTIRGRVHANGPICLGAASVATLKFKEAVTTASSIVYSNMAGYSNFSTAVYEGTPTNRIGTPKLRLAFGTNDTPAAHREIINLTPLGEGPDALLGQLRYHNKASLVLLVSNTSVTLVVKEQGALTGYSTNVLYNSSLPSNAERTNLAQAFPFLSVTNRFRDYRESKWVMPTEINMGLLKDWLPTNTLVLSQYPAGSTVYPNVMYVADLRTITNLHAVRVSNGTIIPTNGPSHELATGFTLATPNPLYVWGNYNLPHAAHFGSTNTTLTFPASLVADSITVLSPNWTDNGYGNDITTPFLRNAANATVNAAVLAGSVYTTGSDVGQWSGGVQNLVRLLENWSGRILTLNTSLVVLYNSARATNQFQNAGVYYLSPTRNYNFDQNFLSPSKLPPGTPMVSGIVPPN